MVVVERYGKRLPYVGYWVVVVGAIAVLGFVCASSVGVRPTCCACQRTQSLETEKGREDNW